MLILRCYIEGSGELHRIHGTTRIILSPRPGRLGIGTAYQHGVANASGDHILIMDANVSQHPKFLLALIKRPHETGSDVVTETRYATGNVSVKKIAAVVLRLGGSNLAGSYRVYRQD